MLFSVWYSQSCIVAHQIAMYVQDHSLLTVTAWLLVTQEESSCVVVSQEECSRFASACVFLLMLVVHTMFREWL